MQIPPLTCEHLFYKYLVRRSVGQATKSRHVKIFCKYFVHLTVGNDTKGFVTYGCFHPYFIIFKLSHFPKGRKRYLRFPKKQGWYKKITQVLLGLKSKKEMLGSFF